MAWIPIPDISGGLKLDVPAVRLDPRFCVEARNILVTDGYVEKRTGYAAYGSALNGVPMLIMDYLKLDGTHTPVALTLKDVYSYSGTTATLRTPTYATGTATFIKYSAVVTGSGTSWLTNAAVGDKIKCDADGTWYEILTVDSNTQITLLPATPYAGTTAIGAAYTIRRLFTATQDQAHSWALMNDTLIFSNYANTVKKWTGSGNVAALGGGAGYQTATTHRAGVVCEFMDSFFLADIVEDGTAVPQRVRWSDIGAPETWSSANFVDLVEDQRGITAMRQVGTILAIFKARSIVTASYRGSASIPFNFDNAVPDVGCDAPRTLWSFEDRLYFKGFPHGIYIYEGGRTVREISKPVRAEMFTKAAQAYMSQYPSRAWAFLDAAQQLYFVALCSASAQPDRVWVWDLRDEVWSDCDWAMVSNGMAVLDSTLQPYPLMGDASGNIYKVDWSSKSDGTAATDGYWTSAELTFSDNGKLTKKRMTQISFDAKGDAVTPYYSIDGGATWNTLTAQTLTSAWANYRVSLNDAGRSFRLRFRNNTAAQTFAIRGPIALEVQEVGQQ